MSDITVAILSSSILFPKSSLDLIRRQTLLPDNRVILFDSVFPYKDLLSELEERRHLRVNPLFVLADVAFAEIGSIPDFACHVAVVNPNARVYLYSLHDHSLETGRYVCGRLQRDQLEDVTSAINTEMFKLDREKEKAALFEKPPWVI